MRFLGLPLILGLWLNLIQAVNAVLPGWPGFGVRVALACLVIGALNSFYRWKLETEAKDRSR